MNLEERERIANIAWNLFLALAIGSSILAVSMVGGVLIYIWLFK